MTMRVATVLSPLVPDGAAREFTERQLQQFQGVAAELLLLFEGLGHPDFFTRLQGSSAPNILNLLLGEVCWTGILGRERQGPGSAAVYGTRAILCLPVSRLPWDQVSETTEFKMRHFRVRQKTVSRRFPQYLPAFYCATQPEDIITETEFGSDRQINGSVVRDMRSKGEYAVWAWSTVVAQKSSVDTIIWSESGLGSLAT
ncbi:hypothetical protein B0H17DRAFT_1130393 [Mycena rosella]|uniref:Uncharacterized protein n=1 Tax=Mycena rosella TaxID=1033263 RepID=A0AAD7GJB8_MYCRO|nr:hypothetical protein B0H17DRAFT_1130393 [Mycena rosella]